MQRTMLGMIASIALAACGGEEQAAAKPMPVEDTVFGDMVSTKDKASAVQDTMDTRAADLENRMRAEESDAAQ